MTMHSESKGRKVQANMSPRQVASVTKGVLTDFSDGGSVMVDFPNNPFGRPVPATVMINVTPRDVGREAVLVFVDGDSARPIIMGLIPDQAHEKPSSNVEVTADGKRVVLTAADEIVLRCGEASITLTRAGKVLIRGKYVLSRSSGSNRIKGGSVEIN